MAKKNDVYEDFLKTIEERERIIQEQRMTSLLAASLTIVISALGFLLYNHYAANQLFPIAFFTGSESQSISTLRKNIDTNTDKINKLEQKISSSSKSSNIELESRVAAIELKNSYLYQTILKDPDTAITPILLRKEQDTINRRIDELQAQVERTNNWLEGILGTILVSALLFFARQIYNFYFSKKDLLKE